MEYSYEDEEAIREFEEDSLKLEIRNLMAKYEKNRHSNSHARIIPWNIYFDQYEEEIKTSIRNRFKFIFI